MARPARLPASSDGLGAAPGGTGARPRPRRAERALARLLTGPPGHLASFAADLASLLLAVGAAALRRRLRRPRSRRCAPSTPHTHANRPQVAAAAGPAVPPPSAPAQGD